MNAVGDVGLIFPERPDLPVHHGDVLQSDYVKSVNYVGDANPVIELQDCIVLRLSVLLDLQVLFRRRRVGLPESNRHANDQQGFQP